MSVKIADVQDAWNLRFSCPDAVQSWLDGVQASDADQAPLLIIRPRLGLGKVVGEDGQDDAETERPQRF
ncbi:hypothetical protein, partial [Deinococcus soli (ex Cha et al. 2016)]|uniref:hypothetical protein n=1 Tax=Deinococcus soli (ex Cha et al. 2016) TaxID=1309411 RepID=UPI001E2A469F